MTLYSYVVDHDTGYAPHPFDGLCTLVGCKFSKHKDTTNVVELATKGDWIVGLGGASKRSSGQGTLIYAMKVKEAIPLTKYCRRYRQRADAKPARNQPWRKALISSDYYYFGRHAVKLKEAHYSKLKVGRRFRDHFPEDFIDDFVKWLRKQKRPKTAEPCVSQIYLINVGANVADASRARSPIFRDGSFEFITFTDSRGADYPKRARPYVRDWRTTKTHPDPDWKGLTYGDNCQNPRARALLKVKPNDILLFWAMLWKKPKSGTIWDSRDKGWYLIGALRVEQILKTGDVLNDVLRNRRLQQRAARNPHTSHGRVEPRPNVRLFFGNPGHSSKFARAVDLGIYRRQSLLKETVRTTDGAKIHWHKSPRWNSVLRSCRAILDTADSQARVLREAIRRENPRFNLLAASQ